MGYVLCKKKKQLTQSPKQSASCRESHALLSAFPSTPVRVAFCLKAHSKLYTAQANFPAGVSACEKLRATDKPDDDGDGSSSPNPHRQPWNHRVHVYQHDRSQPDAPWNVFRGVGMRPEKIGSTHRQTDTRVCRRRGWWWRGGLISTPIGGCTW